MNHRHQFESARKAKEQAERKMKYHSRKYLEQMTGGEAKEFSLRGVFRLWCIRHGINDTTRRRIKYALWGIAFSWWLFTAINIYHKSPTMGKMWLVLWAICLGGLFHLEEGD